jgi:hypothetical protein
MDTNAFLDVRLAPLCGMLFTTVVALTAREPECVPVVFQRIWHRYQLYQEIRRIRSSQGPAGRFWEIDMTNFEP